MFDLSFFLDTMIEKYQGADNDQATTTSKFEALKTLKRFYGNIQFYGERIFEQAVREKAIATLP